MYANNLHANIAGNFYAFLIPLFLIFKFAFYNRRVFRLNKAFFFSKIVVRKKCKRWRLCNKSVKKIINVK